MHWWNETGWGHHMGMMWIWVILGALLVAALVFFLARSTSSIAPRRGEAEDDPEAILKRRYARGEIDEQELHRRMDELHAS